MSAATRTFDAASGRRSLSDLPGWSDDDHGAALAAYRKTAPDMSTPPVADARDWLEAAFSLGRAVPAHVTGYYEPELIGSLTETEDFPVPVHGVPPVRPTVPRAEIEPLLHGHELCWLRDEVDRFFLQVQGSGRVRLADGQTRRLGFAAGNGQPYRSIGTLLVERGELGADVSADQVKAWLRADPDRGRALMIENPSYVMFRFLDLPGSDGPLGAMDVPVTPLRSVAVDPTHHGLGGLFWLEMEDVRRLVVAQDTGSAIKGAGRVDLFHGTGKSAGVAAGQLNETGWLTPLIRS